MIPNEYYIEAEHVLAEGRIVSLESMEQWYAELQAAGFVAGSEPNLICRDCNRPIDSKHTLLKDLRSSDDVRLHRDCYWKRVEEMARTLFTKGGSVLSGEFRYSDALDEFFSKR